MALVVLVAGLLVGSSVAAREMVSTTRAKALAREMVAVIVAVDTYQDKYHQLPGDDPLADRHLGGAPVAAGAGNGVIDGAWNATAAGIESTLMWEHPRLAGLLPLRQIDDGPDPRPRHVADGRLGASGLSPSQRQVAGLAGTLQVCADGVPGRLAKLVDRILDDGDTAAGSVRVVPQGAPPGSAGVATGAIDDGAAYVVCQAH